MNAVVISGPENGRFWRWAQVADPDPGPNDVVIEVAAAGLNHADLLMRSSDYVPSDASWQVASDRVGFECAGMVVAAGSQVSSIRIGDHVMAQTGGACAELVSVDAGLVLPSRGLRDAVAAALPSWLLTEYDALEQADFVAGEDVLVTGGSSGVGRIGVQLARALGARTVIATTRTGNHVSAVQALGASFVVETNTQTIGDALAEAGHPGCPVMLDHVGGELLAQLLDAAPPRARIVQIGRLAGDRTTIDLALLSAQRLALIGTTFRSRDLDELRDLAARVREDPRLADRWAAVVPSIDREYEMHQPEHAARRLMQGPGGKVIMRINRNTQIPQ